MNIPFQRFAGPLRAYYDKFAVLLALALLMVSVFVLAARTATEKKRQVQFERKLRAVQPQYPTVTPADRDPVLRGIRELDRPLQLSVSPTNSLLVPEQRVSCVWCRKPIPYAAAVCPFPGCGKPQPTVPGKTQDTDGDGMPDDWEARYSLNPQDRDDAGADPDKDGFTNLEEFRAGEVAGRSTHPKEARDRPPAWAFNKLLVSKVAAPEFKLVFAGSMRLSGNESLFQINHADTAQSYVKKLNDEVLGFRIVRYDEKYMTATGAAGVVRRDVSELTLRAKDGDDVVLVRGIPRRQWDATAELLYVPERVTIPAKAGGTFEVAGRKYTVKEVDAAAMRVVIVDVTLQREVSIGRSGLMN